MFWKRPASVPVAGSSTRSIDLERIEVNGDRATITLSIDVATPGEAQFRLYNEIGQMVWQSPDQPIYADRTYDLSVPSIASGVYVLEGRWSDGEANRIPVRIVR
jgi:hypothetical protein